MAYKNKTVEVKAPFTYKGVHYKKVFEGNWRQIKALKQKLKQ